MEQKTKERLAESLTASTTDIIPYLPYLLQDFWSLASDSGEMIKLLKEYTNFGAEHKVIDLACGKGAVSIGLAEEFGCMVKGIDLISEFIEEACQKSEEYGVASLCAFVTGDVNQAVCTEQNYDLAVWGGAGDLLGGYRETLVGISRTVKYGGYIMLDEAYIKEGSDLRFYHDYLTLTQWKEIFSELELTEVARLENEQIGDPGEYAEDLNHIRKRAEELAERHAEKRVMFEEYVKTQQNEYEDLQDGVIGTLWLLKKQ